MIRLADNLQIDLQRAAGQRIAVIGKSGSGKTNSLIVFTEEWNGCGLPATIIDPMAQFVTLPDRQPAILAGRGKTAHIAIDEKNAASLAEFSLRERVTIILDFSLYSDDETMEILKAYLEALWARIFLLEEPQPYALIIDEAHLFAPQSGITPLSKTIIDMAKRGRHKRLTTVVATQRAAAITKEFLTQATLLIAHRLSFGIDTNILKEQLPLPGQQLNAMMRKLQTGAALVIGDAALVGDEDYLMVQVRQASESPSAGSAPIQITAGCCASIDEVIKTLLTEIESGGKQSPADDEMGRLRDEVRGLNYIINEKDEEISRLKAVAALALIANALPVKQPRLPVTNTIQAAAPAVPQGAPVTSPNSFSSQVAISRQRTKLNNMITEIRKATSKERALFVLLLGNPDKSISSVEASRRLGYHSSELGKRPPVKLMKMGLIQRTSNYEYYVSMESITRQFPNLPADELVSDLSGVV